MSDVAVCTIVAKNYLAYARVLAHSLRHHHPDLPVFVMVVDRPDGLVSDEDEPFEVIWLDDTPLRELAALRFRYSLRQVLSSVKPIALRALLDRGFRGALFLDADMLVLDRLEPLLDPLRDRSIVLTPHLLEPPRGPDRIERELDMLVSGVFNGGVLGVSEGATGRAFLGDLEARLSTHCRPDPERGMHYDQRWLDLVPSRYADLAIVRDPTVNVGYWALPERRVRMEGDTLLAGESPCRLFHFSGFEPWHPNRVTRHVPELKTADLGSTAAIFARYVRLLADAGVERSRQFPYSFERFDNGVPVPDVARLVYQDLGEEAERFGDPFAVGPGSFLRWLSTPADAASAETERVSRLWNALYWVRPDLQRSFPDHLGADRRSYVEWTRLEEPGRGIDAAFVL